MLHNRIYDGLKWVALILMPAFALLIQGLGEVYSWEEASRLVGLVQVLAVFLGSVLQVSSYHYHQGGGGFDNFSGFA